MQKALRIKSSALYKTFVSNEVAILIAVPEAIDVSADGRMGDCIPHPDSVDLRFTKPLPDSVSGGIASSYDKASSDTSSTPSKSDAVEASLRQLVRAWPGLPASVRDCIVTIVTTVTDA